MTWNGRRAEDSRLTSKAAFRDRDAGSNRNRERTTDNTGEHTHDGPRRGGRGGARGGHRGNRQGQGREFDRHSQTGRVYVWLL